MNRVALILGFLGAVLTPFPLLVGEAQTSSATSLPEAARAVTPELRPAAPMRETMAVWTSALAPSAAALPEADPRVPTPDYAEEAHDPIWAVVVRGATLRASASVASPPLDYVGVGSELNILSIDNGWYEVSNPETGKRGWIFGAHYLDPVGKRAEPKVAAKPSEPAKKVAPVKQVALSETPSDTATTPSGSSGGRYGPYLLAPAAESAPVVKRPAKRGEGESVYDVMQRALRN
jgi:hypothetical protein